MQADPGPYLFKMALELSLKLVGTTLDLIYHLFVILQHLFEFALAVACVEVRVAVFELVEKGELVESHVVHCVVKIVKESLVFEVRAKRLGLNFKL